MQDHHYVYIKANPGMTEEWLQEQLNKGFDIHHIDGDHENAAMYVFIYNQENPPIKEIS